MKIRRPLAKRGSLRGLIAVIPTVAVSSILQLNGRALLSWQYRFAAQLSAFAFWPYHQVYQDEQRGDLFRSS
jgi:hypothetical protein